MLVKSPGLGSRPRWLTQGVRLFKKGRKQTSSPPTGITLVPCRLEAIRPLRRLCQRSEIIASRERERENGVSFSVKLLELAERTRQHVKR